MNAKNYELIFNEETAYIVTWMSEQGESIDTEIIACIEVEELEKEFVAALPIEEHEEIEEGAVLFLTYSEDANGDPIFAPIEDDEELEIVCSAFEQFFAEEEDEDVEYDEDADYLDDISDLFPGVSIKRD